MNKAKISEKESVTLQSIVAVDGTSRMEVLDALKASKIKSAPGALLNRAKNAGLIKKVEKESGVFYFLINNKGGENMEKTIKASKETKPEVSEEVREMIWQIAEHKKEVFRLYPNIFGGIRSIEYNGKAVTMKHSKKGKLFYNFLEEEGVEMVKLIYFSLKGQGIIK